MLSFRLFVFTDSIKRTFSVSQWFFDPMQLLPSQIAICFTVFSLALSGFLLFHPSSFPFIFCLPSLSHVGLYPFFISCSAFFKSFIGIEMDSCFSVHWSYPHGESFLLAFYSQYIGLSLSSKLVYSFCLFVFISGTFRSAYILMMLLASFESGLLSFSCYDFQSVHWSIPLCLWWILTPVQNTIRSLTPKSFAFCESKSDHWSIPFLTIVFVSGLFKILTSDFYFFL